MTRNPQQQQNALPKIDVLAVCNAATDCYTLQAIFSETNWDLQCVSSVTAAKRLLSDRPAPVVLSATELVDGTWRDIVTFARQMSERGKTIVFTSKADEHLWEQILAAGADDVLTKPFDSSDLYEVVCLAYHAWARGHASPARS